MSLRVLIVDDEPLARQRLRDLLDGIDEVVVAGDVDSGVAAVERCSAGAIDLVLLDIRMPGIDGLETARQLAALSRTPVVIFLTAHDDRAIDAFETGAIDYLLKPVRVERLQQAIARARKAAPAPVASGILRRHFIVRRGNGVLRVPIDHALYLRAEDKYVCIVTGEGEHLIEESLTAIEREFGERFQRIHRNCLVAAARIRGLIRGPDGVDRVLVEGLTDTPEVSRRCLPAVRARLLGNA